MFCIHLNSRNKPRATVRRVRTAAVLMVLALSAAPCSFARADPQPGSAHPGDDIHTDVLVFDSSPAGIIAAIAVASEGFRVVLLTEDRHVGGMRTSGLSMANIGLRETFGGLGREFHARIHQYYLDTYGASSRQAGDCDEGFRFEPHVAEKIFDDWLAEAGVEVFREESIIAVNKQGARILSVQTTNRRVIAASVFMDASYEGDLFALAGCSYHLGRESRGVYGETLAGITYPPSKEGQGDDKVQGYVYRLVLTDDPENRVPFSRPDNYHRATYMLDAAELNAFPPSTLRDVLRINMIPNRKTDVRVSEGWLGGSFAWPEATPGERAVIAREHREYAQGYLWFLLNDASIPDPVKQELKQWGYARDEFMDNDHWPYHLYVREARRLTGDYVMTEHDILQHRFKPDAVAIGSFMLDVHPIQYVPLTEERVDMYSKAGGMVREGGIRQAIEPYEIPYRVLLPKRSEVENLLVPVCVSSSHIAYSTIRMEPNYMMLGHAAGLAAVMSIREGVAVHDISTGKLRTRLRKQGAVLDARAFNP